MTIFQCVVFMLAILASRNFALARATSESDSIQTAERAQAACAKPLAQGAICELASSLCFFGTSRCALGTLLRWPRSK